MAIVLPTNSDTDLYDHQEGTGSLVFPEPFLGPYVFDASDAGPTDTSGHWSNDSNAFDGSTATFATTSTFPAGVLKATGTDAPTSGVTIDGGQFRVYRDIDGGGPAWTNWLDIGDPPGGWTWQKLADLHIELSTTATRERYDVYDSDGGTLLAGAIPETASSSVAVARVEVRIQWVPTDEDYYVIFAAKDDNASGFNTPSGWNQWFHFADAGGDDATVAGYYIKASSVTGDTTLSVSGADAGEEKNGVMFTVTGADSSTFEDVAPVTNSHQNTDAPDPSVLGSSTTDNAVVIAITANRTDAGHVDVTASAWDTTPPSGYTIESNATAVQDSNTAGAPGRNVFGTGAGDSQLTWAWVETDPGATENPGAFGSFTNTRDHKIVTMAIRAADVSGPQTVTGSLLTRSPTFPTGAVNPGNVTTVGTLLSKSGTFPTGSANATNTIIGSLLSRSPTFPTGIVTPGNVTIVGSLLTRSPTFPVGSLPFDVVIGGVLLSRSPAFPTGAVNATNTIAGGLLSRSPTFPTGAVLPGNVTIDGSLLSRSPTFPTGSVTLAAAPQTITGILLTRSPTFPTGTIQASNTVGGVLLSRSPTFPSGTLSTEITIDGSLLTRSPTFPVGTITPGNVTIGGVLLARSPTFPTGAVTSKITVVGSLLSRSPSFPTGALSTEITVAGTLLSRSPTFPTGVVQATNTITGLLLSRSPTFPTGAVAGAITIVGTLLSRSPTFPIGAVTLAAGPQTVTGILFARAPTFPTGAVNPGNVTITGVLFSKAGTFPTGAVSSVIVITGVLLSRPPTFPVGSVSSAITIIGVLLARAPTFPTGTVIPGNVTITGVLLVRSPTFPLGSLTSVLVLITAVSVSIGTPRASAVARSRASVTTPSRASDISGRRIKVTDRDRVTSSP